MEKSQKTYIEFEDQIRTELLARLKRGELSEEEILQLKKEKVVDTSERKA